MFPRASESTLGFTSHLLTTDVRLLNFHTIDNHTDGQKEIKGVSIRQSQMHWHSGPVLSLIYTGEGSGLLSGGFEGVLVMWELTSGRRNFLPRLGGAIRSLSVNPVETIYTVTCGDNAVRFVSAMSFSLVAHVRGIRPIDAFQGPKKEMIGVSWKQNNQAMGGEKNVRRKAPHVR